MATKKSAPSKRSYSFGKRLEGSDKKRASIFAVARAQLASNGFLALTLDALARECGVTRQTIHNLFGTKTGVLEALFDQIAFDSGIEQMRHVMQLTEAEAMLEGFVTVFCTFWKRIECSSGVFTASLPSTPNLEQRSKPGTAAVTLLRPG